MRRVATLFVLAAVLGPVTAHAMALPPPPPPPVVVTAPPPVVVTPTVSGAMVTPPGGWASLNPQPLPPKSIKTSKRDAVALNPQPLPPGGERSLNPQPLPPSPCRACGIGKIGSGLGAQINVMPGN